MKSRLSEKHITNFCIDMINAIPYCYATKRIANLVKSGEPDVTGIINRIRLEIEYKKPGKDPTPLQSKQLRMWTDLGAIVGVSHSVLETVLLIEKHLTRDQVGFIRQYLIDKSRSILLKEQIMETVLYFIDGDML